MASPRTIVFDLDGTLVDTAPDLLATLKVVLAGEGLPDVEREDFIGYVGSGARVMLDRAFSTAARTLSPERREALFRSYLAEYDQRLADASRPFAGAEAMLDRFVADGWRLAVCTNKLEAPSRKLLGLLGLDHRFAVIAGQDTFGVFKPDPRHLTETIRTAGGTIPNSVMVGDSQVDVDTALAAGVPVVAAAFGYSRVPAADLGADAVIDHFDQLYDAVAALTSANGGRDRD